MGLPPYVLNHITKIVIQECIKTGHVCPHWVNDKIYDDLVFLDKQDNGTRANEYELLQCHTPQLCQHSWSNKPEEITIICRPNNIFSGETCKYTNPLAAEKILKDFKKNLKRMKTKTRK